MKTKIDRSFHVSEFDIMELAGLMVGEVVISDHCFIVACSALYNSMKSAIHFGRYLILSPFAGDNFYSKCATQQSARRLSEFSITFTIDLAKVFCHSYLLYRLDTIFHTFDYMKLQIQFTRAEQNTV